MANRLVTCCRSETFGGHNSTIVDIWLTFGGSDGIPSS